MNWRKVLVIMALIGLSLALHGCGQTSKPNPTPTSTESGVVPPPIPGSITQIAFQRNNITTSPLADFLNRTQQDVRRYWRNDASLRQIDVQYDKNNDRLGYQLHFISLSKLVNGQPNTLTVYYNYDLNLIEEGSVKRHQAVLNPSHKLIGLTCEQDSSCNKVNYVGRPPISINDIKLNFLESYALVADKIQPMDTAAGQPPYNYHLQMEVNQPQWIFYNWRVNAVSGTVSSLSN